MYTHALGPAAGCTYQANHSGPWYNYYIARQNGTAGSDISNITGLYFSYLIKTLRQSHLDLSLTASGNGAQSNIHMEAFNKDTPVQH